MHTKKYRASTLTDKKKSNSVRRRKKNIEQTENLPPPPPPHQKSNGPSLRGIVSARAQAYLAPNHAFAWPILMCAKTHMELFWTLAAIPKTLIPSDSDLM